MQNYCEITLLALGFWVLLQAVQQIRKMAAEAEKAHQSAAEHAALDAKYLSPRMTKAEIAEMHASRWLGD